MIESIQMLAKDLKRIMPILPGPIASTVTVTVIQVASAVCEVIGAIWLPSEAETKVPSTPGTKRPTSWRRPSAISRRWNMSPAESELRGTHACGEIKHRQGGGFRLYLLSVQHLPHLTQ